MLRYVVNQGVTSMFHAGGRVNFAAIGANAFGMGFGSAEMFRSIDYASGQEGKLNEFAATADGDDADSGAAMRATAVSAPYRGCGLNPYTASGAGLRHGDLRAAPIPTAAMKRKSAPLASSESATSGWPWTCRICIVRSACAGDALVAETARSRYKFFDSAFCRYREISDNHFR